MEEPDENVAYLYGIEGLLNAREKKTENSIRKY